MKVRELMELLEEANPNAEVYLQGDEGDEWPVNDVCDNGAGGILLS